MQDCFEWMVEDRQAANKDCVLGLLLWIVQILVLADEKMSAASLCLVEPDGERSQSFSCRYHKSVKIMRLSMS